MLLKANDYLPTDLEVDEFVKELDRQKLSTYDLNWSRPALSHYFRDKYHAPIVSWQLNGDCDVTRMQTAGYLQSAAEVAFFNRVAGRDVADIVREGWPVIVTLARGLDTGTTDPHAVIILEWQNDTVTIVDPDARNNRREFSEAEIRAAISPAGAGTIVLPPDHS